MTTPPDAPALTPAPRFAFAGRVSTEDHQDPEASRNWQLTRANACIAPSGGSIVAEYFDVSRTRALPWQRRPQAAELLRELANPNRGFDAVVIGEPQRVFYGNQFGNTFPLFTHYQVPLWVPEVGGAIDPRNEAHDLIMTVFGGMSKGERNRIRVRVQAAMAAQAQIEGRYLGGRPPYGYMLIDLGPHPHPEKAADGRRLFGLAPDPKTFWVVVRIFEMFLRGIGIYAIAEILTAENIPSPSAYDRARNRHRCGLAWSKSAIRAILKNPRYTGHQVWNRQRKVEVLLDVNDVTLGHTTKLVWNDPEDWVWSDHPVHEPLVARDDFDRAETLMADPERPVKKRARRTTHTYVLQGRFTCTLCTRKMEGNWSNGQAYYRCRYPAEYARTNHVNHPLQVYVREADVLPALDTWLARAFAPHRFDETIALMLAAQGGDPGADAEITRARAKVAECDRKITGYQAVLDAGGDPATVAAWTRQATAERATAQTIIDAWRPQRGWTEPELRAFLAKLGDLAAAVQAADRAGKKELYKKLGVKLAYAKNLHTVTVEIDPDAHDMEISSCPRVELNPHTVTLQLPAYSGQLGGILPLNSALEPRW